MSITAWQLCSWPTCPWMIPDDSAQWPAFVHVQSSVSPNSLAGQADLRHGDTVWVGTVGSMIVGVGWEWIELRRGVFMLKDPNYVTTNLQFLGQGQAPQNELDAIVSANRLAHALPWQATLTQVLAATRTAEAVPVLPSHKLHQLRPAGLPRPQAASWPAAAAAAA